MQIMNVVTSRRCIAGVSHVETVSNWYIAQWTKYFMELNIYWNSLVSPHLRPGCWLALVFVVRLGYYLARVPCAPNQNCSTVDISGGQSQPRPTGQDPSSHHYQGLVTSKEKERPVTIYTFYSFKVCPSFESLNDQMLSKEIKVWLFFGLVPCW